MTKIDMKKINRVFRKSTGRKTHGVSLEEKAVIVISQCGEVDPGYKNERVSLAAYLLSQFNKQGFKKGAGSTIVKRASAHTRKPIKSGSRKKASDAFYASWEWAQVRYEALQIHGRQCMCCGWTPEPGGKGKLCVDHIKPRSKYPALALDVNNLQVLCSLCNRGKSNIYEDDFRAEWHGEEDADDVDPLTAQFNAIMQ